jgi:hypothetical protein
MRAAFLKAAGETWRDRLWRLVHDTPVEIWIGAVVLGAAFGGVSYHINSVRAERVPVAFSEIGKTVREFNRLGKPVPPLTKFYASASDAAMKVFESHNIALETGRGHRLFASELETRTDRALRIYWQLSEIARDMPADAQAALTSLDKLVRAGADLPAVVAALDAAWDARHDDVYHTEYDTSTQCDSNGQNCQTVTTSRQVYDYTIHTYTYHPQQGENADRLLEDFLKKHPDLKISERLHLATKTEADNEYAIEKSMKVELKGKIPTQEQALKYANMWATGSNLTKYQPVILSSQGSLSGLSPAWHAAKTTAQSVRYTTYSSSDSGPREYQVAESALGQATTMLDAAQRIVGGVRFAGYGVPALHAKVKEFVGVALDGKPGNAGRLREEAMQLARDVYQKNFENGLDVQPFKWREVLLFTLIGILAGGLAGYGVDRAVEARRNGAWRAGAFGRFSR